MTLHLLVPHPENTAPGQRLKFEQYLPHWRAEGWTVVHDAFYWPALEARLRRPLTPVTCVLLAWACVRRLRSLWIAAHADVVYLFLEAVPAGPPILEWLIVHVLRRPVVYDLDDCVFLPKPGSRNPIPTGRREVKIARLIRWSRHTIVCTPHLEAVARESTDRVTRIPATLDLARYTPRKSYAQPPRVVIGWSGSFSTSAYLHLLDDVLVTLQQTYGVRIRVMGDPDFAIPGCDVEATAWSAAKEVPVLRSFDIGLYPLPCTTWDLGKSGLKALQYMAVGVPVVLTPFGATLSLVEHGVNGLFARKTSEWHHALARLIEDPALREQLGRAGRRTVERGYSVIGTWPVYRGIVDGAVKPRAVRGARPQGDHRLNHDRPHEVSGVWPQKG